MTPQPTYRHRNTRWHTAAKELIHTFWVGQRVVRTGDRKAYVDEVIEEGIITALPSKGDRTLAVQVWRDAKPLVGVSLWSPTECMPMNIYLDRQAKRFAYRAQLWRHARNGRDRDGNLKPQPDTT